MTEATLFLPGLSPVGGKTITATFDGGRLSSNGGVLILREMVLSRHIPDDRDRMRITHSYSDMTRARMFAIASAICAAAEAKAKSLLRALTSWKPRRCARSSNAR
jgi:hypothetical protein